jgi:hypothetical protein
MIPQVGRMPVDNSGCSLGYPQPLGEGLGFSVNSFPQPNPAQLLGKRINPTIR